MKKPIALLQTDKHAHKDNISIYQDSSKQAVDLAKKLQINYIFDLGDRVDSRLAQPESILNLISKDIEFYHQNGLQTIQIPGNHDKTDYRSESSFLDPYAYHPSFQLVTSYHHFSLNNQNLGFWFIPYFEENTTYFEYITRVRELVLDHKKKFPQSKHFLFTHIAVDGVRNNSAKTQENLLKFTLFDCFYKVFVGHYHDQQIINNVYYIGSGYPQSFGEDNEKGFTILYDDGSHEFIKADFKPFNTYEIDLNTMLDSDIVAFKAAVKEAVKTENVRVIIKGPIEKVRTFDEKELKQAGIKVVKENKSANKDISIIQISSFSKSSIEEEFNKFISYKGIENAEIGLKYLHRKLNEKGKNISNN